MIAWHVTICHDSTLIDGAFGKYKLLTSFIYRVTEIYSGAGAKKYFDFYYCLLHFWHKLCNFLYIPSVIFI
ncbi:hypothetical protein XBP1_1290003 [Xenorhabdus bovienii str. puntauvense]|uniref:Uncharacterized protein n=1 Tax=Xenorhabdus bovienii str. puntauvense TaxID=1398201 RepID=A0A077NAZ2_XENBV|nr:hypothetical protein XBFFR1_1090005 [Xenorhabdus bovienii str. feltiae France]CDG90834.1 hypothetical protein XBFFL1_1100005 [Xenorhabdus bovienii str. feltiae Florida]CDG95417.1 hypothetical protein XBP1_1290003 [Xenorhabdus bovienii str. puntauvense]